MTQAQLPQQLGDTQVSRQVRSRKKLPMSAIESSAPVSRPPLNSVPARPFVIFNAKTAQRRQLIAAIPAAFLAFHSTSSLCAVVFRVWSKILCDFTSSEFRFPARCASSITLRGIGEGDGPLQVFAIVQGNPLRPACVLMGIG